MALVLTGNVIGMRPVAAKNGDSWQFLSLEISDPTYGRVYSCQMRDRDKQFSQFVQGGKLVNDLTEHKVKVTVIAQTAGPRTIKKKVKGPDGAMYEQEETVMQIRSQITNIRDLGNVADED